MLSILLVRAAFPFECVGGHCHFWGFYYRGPVGQSFFFSDAALYVGVECDEEFYPVNFIEH